MAMQGGDIGVGSPSPSVMVYLYITRGLRFLLFGVNLNSSVKDFRPAVTHNSRIPAERQILIYKGRVMTDDRTLQSYGVEQNATIFLVDFHGADFVNASSKEDFVANLENLDLASLENVVNRLNDRLTTLRNANSAAASTSSALQINQTTESKPKVELSPTLGPSQNDGAGTSQSAAAGDVVGQNNFLILAQETYQNQVFQLWLRGFEDTFECAIALVATEGDIEAAVQRLRAGIPSVNPYSSAA